jgi:hypothetical protein
MTATQTTRAVNVASAAGGVELHQIMSAVRDKDSNSERLVGGPRTGSRGAGIIAEECRRASSKVIRCFYG